MLKEKFNELLNKYPESDLIQSEYAPSLAAWLTKAKSNLATAITLDDTKAFETAKKEYIDVYQKFKEANLCISDAAEKRLQKEITELQDRIILIDLRHLVPLKYELKKLTERIDSVNKDLEENEALKLSLEDKIKELKGDK